MTFLRPVLPLDIVFGEEIFGRAVLMAPRASLGALLLGSLLCMFLSGILAAQTFLYTTLYPRDKIEVKATVAAVWLLDLLQSAMACTAMWTYLIENFGILTVSDHIIWALAVSVLLTALVTFVAHMFFAQRILTIAGKKWAIAAPVGVLAFARLALGLVCAGEMFRVSSFSALVSRYRGIFSTAMTLGFVIDTMITVTLCVYLRHGSPGFSSVDKALNSFSAYAVENGMLTCIATLLTMIFWYSMPNNLVFLGVNFVVAKLYATTFVATLNARRELVSRSQGTSDQDHPMPLLFPHTFSRGGRHRSRDATLDPVETGLQINVEKTVQREVDYEPSEGGAPDGDSVADAESQKVRLPAEEDA